MYALSRPPFRAAKPSRAKPVHQLKLTCILNFLWSCTEYDDHGGSLNLLMVALACVS